MPLPGRSALAMALDQVAADHAVGRPRARRSRRSVLEQPLSAMMQPRTRRAGCRPDPRCSSSPTFRIVRPRTVTPSARTRGSRARRRRRGSPRPRPRMVTGTVDDDPRLAVDAGGDDDRVAGASQREGGGRRSATSPPVPRRWCGRGPANASPSASAATHRQRSAGHARRARSCGGCRASEPAR